MPETAAAAPDIARADRGEQGGEGAAVQGEVEPDLWTAVQKLEQLQEACWVSREVSGA